MLIRSIEQTSQGVYKISPNEGSAFFLRKDYLSLVPEEKLLPFAYGRLDIDFDEVKPNEDDMGFFNEEESCDILNAAFLYSVEKIALTYLSRAEHCRMGLYKKLLAKQIDKNAINSVLDYLESVNLLNDYRFASAWLRTRSINHFEGRIRLSAELQSRGLEKESAKKALDEFFLEKDEQELCKKAYKKLQKVKKSNEKTILSLKRLGFTNKEISCAMKN